MPLKTKMEETSSMDQTYLTSLEKDLMLGVQEATSDSWDNSKSWISIIQTHSQKKNSERLFWISDLILIRPAQISFSTSLTSITMDSFHLKSLSEE